MSHSTLFQEAQLLSSEHPVREVCPKRLAQSTSSVSILESTVLQLILRLYDADSGQVRNMTMFPILSLVKHVVLDSHRWNERPRA